MRVSSLLCSCVVLLSVLFVSSPVSVSCGSCSSDCSSESYPLILTPYYLFCTFPNEVAESAYTASLRLFEETSSRAVQQVGLLAQAGYLEKYGAEEAEQDYGGYQSGHHGGNNGFNGNGAALGAGLGNGADPLSNDHGGHSAGGSSGYNDDGRPYAFSDLMVIREQYLQAPFNRTLVYAASGVSIKDEPSFLVLVGRQATFPVIALANNIFGKFSVQDTGATLEFEGQVREGVCYVDVGNKILLEQSQQDNGNNRLH